MGPKSESFTIDQVKDILSMHEKTLIAFFNGTVERLENKIDKVVKENIELKNEVNDLKTSIQFHSDLVEDKVKEVNAKLAESSKSGLINVEDKLDELEDRSRRNNLRIHGIEEDDDETWEGTETKLKSLIKGNLGIKTVVHIERAHRSGNSFQNGEKRTKRTVIAKFLNFKNKQMILDKYREKKLWENGVYIKEDFSEGTMKKRKLLFQEEKMLREKGDYAKVIYNKLIHYKKRNSVEG